jgi:hypothetical protein
MTRAACVWLLCVVATSASAQTTTATEPSQPMDQNPGPAHAAVPAPPPRRPVLEPPQSMWLTLSLFGGSNDADGALGGGGESSGVHEDLDAMMTYRRKTRRTAVGVDARSVVRNGERVRGVTPMYEGVGLSASFTGRRNQFHASQSADYIPYYQFGAASDANAVALGNTAQSHGDFANANLSAFESGTSVALTRAVGRRDSLTMNYDRRQVRFSSSDLDLLSQRIGARFTHHVTEGVSLRAGYGYRTADLAIPGASRLHYHDLDIGLNYSRGLSVTRKTTITFNSGSSIVPQEPQPVAQGENASLPGMSFVMSGGAALTHRMGRTWSARIEGTRGVEMLEGFARPVVANRLATNLAGNWSRWVSFSSVTGFTTGTVGVGGDAGTKYETWNASVALQIAVSRRCAIAAQYSAFSNRFGDEVLLPTGVTSTLQRQVLRIGLTWRTPMIGH